MTPAMQAARDRVVEAAKRQDDLWYRLNVLDTSGVSESVRALLALEAKEKADAEG